MKPANIEKAEWLMETFKHLNSSTGCDKLIDFLPPVFDEYLLINWSVGIVDDEVLKKANEYSAPEIDDDLYNTLRHILPDYNEYAKWHLFKSSNENIFKECSLLEVATKTNQEYNRKILDKIDWSKKEFVVLFDKTIEKFKTIVEALSNESLFNFYIMNAFRWHHLWETDFDINTEFFEVSIEGFKNVLEVTELDTTMYLFPDDVSWCLMIVEDSFAVLAFKNQHKDKIAELKLADTFPMKPEEEF